MPMRCSARRGRPFCFAVASSVTLAVTLSRPVRLVSGGLPGLSGVAPVFVQHRVDFATSMIDGRTVCEIDPEGRSAKEIWQLWEYIANQLEKRERQRVFHQPMLHGFGRRPSLEEAKA